MTKCEKALGINIFYAKKWISNWHKPDYCNVESSLVNIIVLNNGENVTFSHFVKKILKTFQCENQILNNLSLSHFPDTLNYSSCSLFHLSVLSLPETLRFTTTGVEVNWEVTAFTFDLLKTGDKKPAEGKESRILKSVIYHVCQNSAETGWKTASKVRKHSLLSIF